MSAIQIPTATTPAQPKKARKLTPAEKLIRSITARKALAGAHKEKKPSMHLTFDDDGKEQVVAESNDSKKQQPASKKRKETEKLEVAPGNKESKKAKKAKKAKQQAEAGPGKRAQALDYLRLFQTDRGQWKFSKKHQIWLLQHIYDDEAVPDQDFERLVEYVKDMEGSAREKTLSGARAICQQSCGQSLTGYAAPAESAGDDDDFDAEKLLAQAASTEPAEENPKAKRAKAIERVLS